MEPPAAEISAAMREVEVDVITGVTSIVATKILYDSGNSLNPMNS